MIDEKYISEKLRRLSVPQKRRGYIPVLRAAAIACLAIASALLAYVIDTKVFPVVSNAHAVIFYNGSDTTTQVRFVFEKNRACKYLNTEFWLMGDTTQPIQLIRSAPPLHFPKGRASTSQLVLDVPRDKFIENGVVMVEHRCHPLWVHKTALYE